jgi:hypothetical protein
MQAFAQHAIYRVSHLNPDSNRRDPERGRICWYTQTSSLKHAVRCDIKNGRYLSIDDAKLPFIVAHLTLIGHGRATPTE